MKAIEYGSTCLFFVTSTRAKLMKFLGVSFFRSLLGATLVAVSTLAVANDVAYMRGATQPWGRSTNEAAMDTVFGAGNWDDLRMADGSGPFQPGSGYRFIFLEGSDDTANELNTYLQAHRAAIEAFVNNGGRLLLNSAPNEGGDIDFGFGGVDLINSQFSSNVTANDGTHPVFNGPETPIVTDYSGNSFGHAIIAGPTSPIIIGAVSDAQEGNMILGELVFGDGLVLFGGMTTDNFHSPDPESANLRANIIAYTAGGAANRLSCEGFLFPMDQAVTVKRSPYGGNQPAALPLMMRLLDEAGVPVYGQDLSSPPVLEVLFDGGEEVGQAVPEELPFIGYGDEGNRFEFVNSYWQFYPATSGFGSLGTYHAAVVSGDKSEYVVDPTCMATFTITNPFSFFDF